MCRILEEKPTSSKNATKVSEIQPVGPAVNNAVVGETDTPITTNDEADQVMIAVGDQAMNPVLDQAKDNVVDQGRNQVADQAKHQVADQAKDQVVDQGVLPASDPGKNTIWVASFASKCRYYEMYFLQFRRQINCREASKSWRIDHFGAR